MKDLFLPSDRSARCRRGGAQARARRRLLVACAAVLAVCLAAAPGAAAAPGYVEARDSQFTLNGRPWKPIGYNQYHLTSMPGGYVCDDSYGPISDASLNQRLGQMQAAGANVVRTWFFQSYYNAGGWAPFDRVLDAAAARGMKVIPVLVNQWVDCEPPSIRKNHGFYQGGFRSPGFGYPKAYKEYARTIADHYKNNSTVAFWQLVNEAEAPYSHDPYDCGNENDSAAALRAFAAEMRSYIREVDTNHLVSLGTIGDGQCGTSDGNYKSVHEVVDVCEIHDYDFASEALPKYPRDPYNNLQRRITQCNELDKPIFVGESGIVADVGPDGQSTGSITPETLQRRADFFEAKIAAQFASPLGADGYLIWEKIVEPSDSPYNYDNERYGVGPGDPTEQVLRDAPGNPPPPPTVAATAPSSPANHNSLRVKGDAEFGSTVRVYETADCSGSHASGSAADFASPGLALSVPDDSTTSFRTTATDEDGNTSACSSSRSSPAGSVTYVEDSTAPSTSDDVPASLQNEDVTVTLTAHDGQGSGVDTTYYEKGADPATPTMSSPVYDPANKPRLADGERIKYFSTDKAQNKEDVRTSPPAKVDEPVPEVSIDDVAVAEGDSGTHQATFKVTRSNTERDATVNYQTSNGTATEPGDYGAETGTVSIRAGETEQEVSVDVKGDTVDEDDEKFTVQLTSADTNRATIGDGIGEATITDDDAPPAITVDDVTVTPEGNSGVRSANFRVELSAASEREVRVNLVTANGTATTPGDYSSTTATVTFAPRETVKAIPVAVKGDALDEAHETFWVGLSSPQNATIADTTGRGTITDDDPRPRLAIRDVSLAEGNAGVRAANFRVSLSAPSGRPVSVRFATANGTARAPGDYTAKTGIISYAPGQTAKLVPVNVHGGRRREPNETFFLDLKSPINATRPDPRGRGTIRNDD